ncbi:MAG: hypothetical protein H7Z17_13400 [Fuerstia sp.]|nr:hypothetical protein [Fuerstiella sp.]
MTALLTAGTLPSQAMCDGTKTQARQTFQVHVPGDIRIVGMHPDANGQPQSVRISAGMDVAVSIQNFQFQTGQPSFNCLIRGGQTVTIPFTQTIDGDASQPLPLLTILPGW